MPTKGDPQLFLLLSNEKVTLGCVLSSLIKLILFLEVSLQKLEGVFFLKFGKMLLFQRVHY